MISGHLTCCEKPIPSPEELLVVMIYKFIFLLSKLTVGGIFLSQKYRHRKLIFRRRASTRKLYSSVVLVGSFRTLFRDRGSLNWTDGFGEKLKYANGIHRRWDEWNGTEEWKETSSPAHSLTHISLYSNNKKIWILILFCGTKRRTADERGNPFIFLMLLVYSGSAVGLSSRSYVLYFIVLKLKYHVIIIGPHRFAFSPRSSRSMTLQNFSALVKRKKSSKSFSLPACIKKWKNV